MKLEPIDVGLEGVVVAETVLSEVDGERGALLLRGHPLHHIAGEWTFEEVVHLFVTGERPDSATRQSLERRLGAARVEAYEHIDRLGAALDVDNGMDALRGAVAQGQVPEDDAMQTVLTLAARVAVFAAAWSARQSGRSLIAPNPERAHAQDLLSMYLGRDCDPVYGRALDTYLTTVVDHGMNASTFTARVVASTESDATSCVVAALGALKGRLHGGAPGPVLDMLDAIGTRDNAEAWLKGELDHRRRIMGMGHRVYRVRDPRAAVLEGAVATLRDDERLALAKATEETAARLLAERHPDRRLRANVEFYTAVLLEALEIPRASFTPTFACGRVVGWLAHVFEQRSVGRLIRPKSRYVGPTAR